MENIEVNVARDFSLTPGPRNIREGDFSGQQFREEILEKKIKEATSRNVKLIINLDGTFGYGSSFLEEAFGGLARNNMDIDIMNYIELISEEEPYLIDDIKKYIKDVKSEN